MKHTLFVPALIAFLVLPAAGEASDRFGLTGLQMSGPPDRLVLTAPTVHGVDVWNRDRISARRDGEVERVELENVSQVERSAGFAVRLAPGGAVVYTLDSQKDHVEVSTAGSAGFLSADAFEAVENAPIWIRDKLSVNLAELSPARQDLLITPLSDSTLQKWWDEIAFLLASIPAGNLGAAVFDVRSIVDQARLIDEMDDVLDYVEIVDREDDDVGPYTTAVYRWVRDGVEQTFELPFPDYYWWVLHPVLDMEEFSDISPETGAWAEYPVGMSWREYYIHPWAWPQAEEDERISYIPHFIFKTPSYKESLIEYDVVPADSLFGWGPVQRGHIREIDVGALHLTVDSQDRPTTIEFRVRPTGTVLATTLEVERAYLEGRSGLLENMLRYGPGNAGFSRWSGKMLVIMDRELFDSAVKHGRASIRASSENPIWKILDDQGIEYDVRDSSTVADVDLSAYSKILVPSDQPVAVYQALSDRTDDILAWLRGGRRILEIHGAVTDASRDWSGIVMPGGFTVDGLLEAVETDQDYARLLGHPFLNPAAPENPDIPKTINVMWDDSVRDVQGGDRFVSDTTCAVDRVTWWAGQNMPDSVIDWAQKHPGMIVSRTSQANKVLYQHFGNCGELQDIQTAAFRTMLIPSANTSNGAEDHVWSEFLTYQPAAEGDEVTAAWHPSGLDWSDGYVNIDNPNVSMSKKFGGGKNISLVTSYRGDGALVNRTSFYADTGHLTVHVRDADSRPVAGAVVLVATEAWALDGESYPLTLAFWDITDSSGDVTIETGANIQDDLETDCQNLGNRCNNYYVRVISDIGVFPDQGVGLAVSAVEAFPGYEKEVTAILDGSLGGGIVPGEGEAWIGPPDSLFRMFLGSVTPMRCGQMGEGYSWCDKARYSDNPDVATAERPGAEMMVLDDMNLQRWLAGQAFDAANVVVLGDKSEANSILLDTIWPSDGKWHVVFRHSGYSHDRVLLRGSFDFDTDNHDGDPVPEGAGIVEPMPDALEDVAEDALVNDVPSGSDSSGESTHGGGCSTARRSSPETTILLFMVVMISFVLSRRRRAGRPF